MTRIEIISITQAVTHFEVAYNMYFDIPSAYAPGGIPIANIDKVVPTFSEKPGAPTGNYSVATIPAGKVIVYNNSESAINGTTLAQAKTALVAKFNVVQSFLNTLVLSPIDQAAGAMWDGTTWGSANNITDKAIPDDDYARLTVSANSAAGAQLTVTLPAIVGKFHAISHIAIYAYNTAARTGSLTPVLVTTTNLNGLGLVFQSAGAIGTVEQRIIEPCNPLVSAAANTATVITCPGTTNVRWLVNVIYDAI